MCFHRRLVFDCAHHAWLGVTRPCELEASFYRGEVDTGCRVRWSHGYDTIRIKTKCRKCIQVQEKTSFRFGIVKGRLKVLKERLALIKGEPLKSVEEACSAMRDDGRSDIAKEEPAGASSWPSSSHGIGETTNTSLAEMWCEEQSGCLEETMEEVRVDPKHRTLELALSSPCPIRASQSTKAGRDTRRSNHTMPWRFFTSSPTSKDEEDASKSLSSKSWLQMTGNDRPKASPSSGPKRGDSWADNIRDHLSLPHNWIAPVAAAALTLGAFRFYQSYLRRIPSADHIAPNFFRRRSLFGKVTSVGDGDGFHLFHTPGGRLAGWGWLRSVPKERKQLKGQTISIRIAGVDAPEGAHFGRPAQPFAAEALAFLESYVLHRRVRARVYKRDQYERVVATVYVRRPPFFFPRRDVGLEMLRRGLAVAYEGKTGAEFGGPAMEARYRDAEAAAKKKGKGLWGVGRRGGLFGGGAAAAGKEGEPETPMAYKKRMKALDELKK
ncbi:hypothetical protein C7999DRAFT_44910 [Corynascus novoguineensis]|uniref:Probable endonuclease LCL3 n=1 Tax=Corynascus novoguineensis TaxID=1126955 RepID=A0AAN7HFE2_9PEZI|nr:hypothetical protein C7999DRAFT_44910 [Corynascus novoguineensis]